MSAMMVQRAVDVSAVTGDAGADTGVANGAELLAFVDAVMDDDGASRARARAALRAVSTPEAFVDACAVVGAFNVVDRIADATGIPLDDRLAAMSADVRRELGIARFASAANSPGAT